jgi:1,4-dihydroxy-6-naphthoate synthase
MSHSPQSVRRLTLGHSPDPDDAFMFCALARGRLETPGFEFEHILQDIETLNQRAHRSELDITALSAHAYAYLTDRYNLLKTGASMGQGKGPMIVGSEPLTPDDLTREAATVCIAVRANVTSAILALHWHRQFNYRCPYRSNIETVAEGKPRRDSLIHEGQLTYADRA